MGASLAAVLEGVFGVSSTPLEGSDEDLVQGSKRGDRNAFSRLVERYQDRVFTLALRLIGDQGGAEDLAQEAFLRAYQAMASFEQGRPFYPWLVTILRNLARNRYRTRLPVPVEVGPEGANPEEKSPGPEALVQARFDREFLKEEVARLPLRFREVLILRYLEDRSIREVADLLEMPEGTVKTNLYRARELLRQRLVERGGRP